MGVSNKIKNLSRKYDMPTLTMLVFATVEKLQQSIKEYHRTENESVMVDSLASAMLMCRVLENRLGNTRVSVKLQQKIALLEEDNEADNN